MARNGRGMAWLKSGSDGGMGFRSRSSAVKTAMTPGAWAASEVSIEAMRAWAIVERT